MGVPIIGLICWWPGRLPLCSRWQQANLATEIYLYVTWHGHSNRVDVAKVGGGYALIAAPFLGLPHKYDYQAGMCSKSSCIHRCLLHVYSIELSARSKIMKINTGQKTACTVFFS